MHILLIINVYFFIYKYFELFSKITYCQSYTAQYFMLYN